MLVNHPVCKYEHMINTHTSTIVEYPEHTHAHAHAVERKVYLELIATNHATHTHTRTII